MKTILPLVALSALALAPSFARGQAASTDAPAVDTISAVAAVPVGPRRIPSLTDAAAPALPAVDVPGSVAAAVPDRRPGTAKLAVAGAAGAGVGFMAGMLVGAAIDNGADDDCIDMCFGTGMLLGALGGEALGMALGVHLANGRQGSLAKNALVSAALLTAGVVATHESGGLMVAVPVGQLVGTITMERADARRR